MFDTAMVTVSGNVVAHPRITGAPDDPDRVNFRVVSTRRRRDPVSGDWVDAGEYGVNVVCWRNLARGVAQSLHRGDPVLVTGRITERPFQGDDGVRRWFTEVTADFVGHDLSKGAARFYRFSRFNRPAEERPHGESSETETETETGALVAPADGDGPDADAIGFDGAAGDEGFSDAFGELSESELSRV